ncbi:MAG TPA: response regulator [Clostridiales bacterium]|nr:response regulator [Clostridiales bacterium]
MGKNILIIDDNKLLTESLKQNIDWDTLGITVSHVLYDALKVKEIVTSERVDLIISDIRMPGMSGLEMVKEVLEINPGIKVILISAYEDFEYVQEAIRLGVFDYIEKPIDLEYLKSIIQKAAKQIDLDIQIKKQLEASKPAMTEKFFNDVLHHAPQEAKFQYSDYLNFLSINAESNYHLCIVIRIRNSAPLKTAKDLEKYHMNLLSFKNFITEQFTDFKLFYLLHNRNSLVLIMGRTFASANQLLEVADERISLILGHPSDLKSVIGVGNPVRSFWKIRESYESAKLALEYRFFLPEERVFYFKDIPSENFIPDINMEAKSKEIINLICKNDVDNLKQYLEQLYRDYLELHTSKVNLFFSINDIAGKVLNFLYKMGVSLSALDENLTRHFGNLNFSTSTELFDWLSKLCIMASEQLDTSVSYYQKRLAFMVDHYIQDNYGNSQLNLNEIAAYVNVSPTYLSATYKKITGKNIIEVISTTRILIAQELLSHSNLSIKDVSEKTGFSNQYYFSTSFKKITGQSPSAFRNPGDLH